MISNGFNWYRYAAASVWTADATARGRKSRATDRIWAESAVVARAGSAARGGAVHKLKNSVDQ